MTVSERNGACDWKLWFKQMAAPVLVDPLECQLLAERPSYETAQLFCGPTTGPRRPSFVPYQAGPPYVPTPSEQAAVADCVAAFLARAWLPSPGAGEEAEPPTDSCLHDLSVLLASLLQ